jgi:hypothetical protein
MVLREGMVLAAVGLAIGLVAPRGPRRPGEGPPRRLNGGSSRPRERLEGLLLDPEAVQVDIADLT